jgi:hypothetical protein
MTASTAFRTTSGKSTDRTLRRSLPDTMRGCPARPRRSGPGRSRLRSIVSIAFSPLGRRDDPRAKHACVSQDGVQRRFRKLVRQGSPGTRPSGGWPPARRQTSGRSPARPTPNERTPPQRDFRGRP